MARSCLKAQDRLIEKIYRQNCSGMQIRMMRIPALFRMARTMLAKGDSEAIVGAAMITFIRAEPVS